MFEVIKNLNFDDNFMSTMMKQYHHKKMLKEERKKEITRLLRDSGPLESREVIQIMGNLHEATIFRYFEELSRSGYIRRVSSNEKRKGRRVYQFLGEYGAKVDIVSLAISHPMHQITLLTSGVRQ